MTPVGTTTPAGATPAGATPAATTTTAVARTTAGTKRSTRLAELPLVPAGPRSGFISGTLGSAKGVWEYRELLGLLVRRELKSRYKDSVLGFLWSLVRPLALLVVYVVAIGQFLGAARGVGAIPEFAIYVYSGLTVWQLFSEIVGAGTGSIVNNGGLVKKIYLPREVFPLAVIGSALFNFIIQLVILFGATIISGSTPSPGRLVWAVAGTGLVLVWAAAFAFALSAINVYLRDVAYIVEIILMFGFWLSPVVYQWSQVKDSIGSGYLETLFLANPVTLSVLSFHRAFWVAGSDPIKFPQPVDLGEHMLVSFLVGCAVLWLCQRLFARLQSNFAQEI